MSLLTFKGVLTAPSGSGGQSITGVGFQPKAVIFFGVDQTGTGFGTLATYGRMMTGFAVSSSQRKSVSYGMRNADTSGLSRNNSYVAASKAIVYTEFSDLSRTADLTSMDADGFTLSWSADALNGSDTTSGIKIHYLALGGTELTNAFVGSLTTPTSTGDVAVTGVGFQPDSILFVDGRAAADSIGGPGFSLGALTSTTAMGGASFNMRGSSDPTRVESYQRSAYALAILRSEVKRGDAKLKTFDSDGFTLTWDVIDGVAWNMPFLALKGAQVMAGVETQKTSTGTKAKTGLGFTPKALFAFGTNRAADTAVDEGSTAGRMSIGASDGTNHGSCWVGAVDNVSTNTQIATHHSTTKFLSHNTYASTVDADATVNSFDSDGFTLNWATADATAREFVWFAIGGSSVVAPVADFTGTPTSLTSGSTVAFTDSSTNTPTSWSWEKNDGSGWVPFSGTPTAQNPTETFT